MCIQMSEKYGTHKYKKNMVPTSDKKKCGTTVKPAHVIISVKQYPAFKGHPFLSCDRKFHMN